MLAEVEKRFGAMPAGPRRRAAPAPLPAMAASREVLEVPGAQAQILDGGHRAHA